MNKKHKAWPLNMKAKDIRIKMEEIADYVYTLQDEYEELEMELVRRGLKV